MPMAIIVVDHGSRRAEANAALDDVVRRYCAHLRGEAEANELNEPSVPVPARRAPVCVEPAHMELAAPSIADAFAACVAAGAREIICAPFFLSPGRHVMEDIPALMGEAAAAHAHIEGIRWSVASPLGVQPSMPALMDEAINGAIGDALDA